ncbi:MAG: polysaccharide biosynthesis C-terminal domain-containing protein [bacterium]|nr:polysaccharide biosynthesis C-terminal domain-containing protein [bacterium]
MSLAKWTLGTFGAQIVGGVFSFIGWNIINARILGPEGKGVVTLAFLYPELFFTLFWLSLNAPYLYHIGRKKYKLGNFAANSLVFAGALGSLALIIFWITFFLFREQLYPGVRGTYLAVTMLLAPAFMIIYYFTTILQGSYNIRDYNLVWLTWRIGGVIFIVLLVLILRLGVWGAIIGGSIAIFSAGAIGIFLVARITKKEDWQIQPQLLKETLIDGIKLHIGGITTFLRSRASIFLLNYYLGVRDVGLFSVALTLSEMLYFIPQATSTVLWPKASGANEEEAARLSALVCRHTLLWMTLAAIILAIGAKFFVFLFVGRVFFPVVLPLIILLPGTVFFSLGINLASLIIRHRKFLLATYISTSLAAINIVLLILLIPRYGLIGAALAILITQILGGFTSIFIFFFLSKRSPKELFCFTKEDLLLYKNLVARIYEKIIKLKKKDAC